MKDLLEKYEKSTVEEQAKLFKETIEEVAKLKTDAEAMVKEREERDERLRPTQGN
jgi:hypothetical protein